MAIPLKVRQGWVEALPWVKKLKRTDRIRCEGIKWGKMALSDTRSMYGKPARGIQPRAMCKRLAHWHYKALPSSHTFKPEGNYCWDHVAQQIEYEGEYKRWLRYIKKHPEKFPMFPGTDPIEETL